METADDFLARRAAIATAISVELERQGKPRDAVNVEGLAAAIDEALEPPAPMGEGKKPSELNSTNDD